MENRLGPLADRLDDVAEELDEIMFDLLREASAAGATSRPVADKKIAQARRSIHRASALLRRVADDGVTF